MDPRVEVVICDRYVTSSEVFINTLYDFMCKFCDARNFEYVEMDTDSAYMSVAGKVLRDIIKPDKLAEYNHELYGNCHDTAFTASDAYFPRECCSTHRKYDKRTPGLFKLEAQGDSMIALCSKTYALQAS